MDTTHGYPYDQTNLYIGLPPESINGGGADVDYRVAQSLSGDVIGHPNSMFDWVPVESINVDEVYQRPLNPSRVQSIADAFDPDVLGVVTLSRRDDGSLWALDGQHRIAAAIAAGLTGKIPAHVLMGLTSQDEARIYYKTNRQRLNTSAIDAFRARLAFEEPIAMGVKATMDEFGIHVIAGMSQGGNRSLNFDEIMAVAEAEQIYKNGLLGQVFAVIDGAWKDQPDAHKANYLRGIATFFSVFNTDFFGEDIPDTLKRTRMSRLISSLAKSPPAVLDARAKFFAETLGARSGVAYARAIHDTFNNRLQGKSRLSRWGTGSTPDGE